MALARAHARRVTLRSISGYLGKSECVDNALATYFRRDVC